MIVLEALKSGARKKDLVGVGLVVVEEEAAQRLAAGLVTPCGGC